MATNRRSDAPALSAGGAFQLCDSGIRVVGTPTVDEWIAAVGAAKEMVRVAPMVLAKLYAYGKSRGEWAQEFYQVVQGYDKRTLDNWASLVNQVKDDVLALAPSLGHADTVRTLPADRQKALLQEAVDEQLPVMELRQRVRHERKIPHTAGHANRDAESCQRLMMALKRQIETVAREAMTTNDPTVQAVCGTVQAMLMDCVVELDGAARALLARSVRPKAKRRKWGGEGSDG